MRKRTLSQHQPPAEGNLDLERIATVEVTSEDSKHPIERALLPGGEGGWRAATPGPQTIRLLFDQPQRLRRIQLLFTESDMPRTQEFVLRWSKDREQSFHEIVRQQWNFSPDGSTRELEDYEVSLDAVTSLELLIKPDIGERSAVASLRQWRLA